MKANFLNLARYINLIPFWLECPSCKSPSEPTMPHSPPLISGPSWLFPSVFPLVLMCLRISSLPPLGWSHSLFSSYHQATSQCLSNLHHQPKPPASMPDWCVWKPNGCLCKRLIMFQRASCEPVPAPTISPSWSSASSAVLARHPGSFLCAHALPKESRSISGCQQSF